VLKGAAPAVWLLLATGLALSSCGRLLQPPPPTQAAAMILAPTETLQPTATRKATFTPVPATPSDTPTPTASPTPIIYVISKGDTLLAIAREFGVTVQGIQDVNGITDPRRLRIDQEIIIPRVAGEGEPTGVPTPTPVAMAIQGLAFHRTPTDSLWCLGEVVNHSGEPAEEVQVEVSLHDEQGALLASGAAFTQVDILPGGGRSPFAIFYPAAPSGFAQYQTRILSGVPSTHLGPRYPFLEVVDDWGGWLDESNYQVRGEVQNTGEEDAERVGSRTVGIPAEFFLSGAVAPFEVTLTPFAPVARYDVKVQGWWVDFEVPIPTPSPEGTATPRP
jgi:LysM repeat protein